MAAPFNYDDPRFQRDRQRAYARNSMGGPARLARVVEGEVSGAHAGYQLGKALQFEQLGLAKRASDIEYDLAKARSAQTDARLGLQKDRMKFQKKEFKRSLRQQEHGLALTTGFGAFMMPLHAMEGRKRAAALEEQTKQTRLTTKLVQDHIKAQTAKRRKLDRPKGKRYNRIRRY